MASNPQNKKGQALKKNKKAIESYMKYSGMGVQMALVIAAGSFAGVYLDKYLETKPLFVVIGSLGAVFLALYLFIRQILAESPPEDQEEE